MFQIKKIQMETTESHPSLLEFEKILKEKKFKYFKISKYGQTFFMEMELNDFKLTLNTGYEIIIITQSMDRMLQEYEKFIE